MMIRTVLISSLALLLTVPADAQIRPPGGGGMGGGRIKLKVGMPAPDLKIKEWVKGEAFDIEEGYTYVVEFWATWCAPCRKSIPHLTALQNDYGDNGLRILGISSGEELSTVEKFVRKQGKKMDYTVAFDNYNGTQRKWMTAAGLDGIPAAFIISDRGIVQWIGHPLDEEFESVLKLVVDGRYDARLFHEMAPTLKAAEKARKIKNWKLAHKHYSDVINADPHVFAFHELDRFEMYLLEQDDTDRAYQQAAEAIKNHDEDATFLIKLAEMITLDPDISDAKRRLDVALKAAEMATDASSANDPSGRAAQALVLFHSGKVEEAVRLQRKAWMIASPKYKPEQKRLLRQYQDARGRVTASRK